MKDECSDLKQAADRAQDKHYREMTDWVTRGRTPEQGRRAYGFAVAYRQALKWLIDCYAHLRDRLSARRNMEAAQEFKTLVEHDIDILDKYSER